MAKRKRPADQSYEVSSKRPRSQSTITISKLSDELLLKILTALPISDLAILQRVSQRFRQLAGDSELWKEKYYSRWVRPRALRIPGFRHKNSASERLLYSSRLAKWLDHSHLVQQDRGTDWKRQYRLRYNWWRGICNVYEVEVAQPPVPPVLVKIHDGVIFTADAENGLRAWSVKSQNSLLAVQSLGPPTTAIPVPTSLGVDDSMNSIKRRRALVGLEDGSFQIFEFDPCLRKFDLQFIHPPSSNGPILSIAIAFPYVLTMSYNKTISLYRFPSVQPRLEAQRLPHPQVLSSLKSNMAYTPLCLSIRPSSNGIVACIAYVFSRLGLGWACGLQELRLTADGENVGSRLASTIELSHSSSGTIKDDVSTVLARSARSQAPATQQQLMARPSSLSYSHPYLLASLPDNTLMIYLVVSDGDTLAINAGRRLWGHTSSVSGAEVSDRGKAVSVSTRGNEIRVWELEDAITSTSQRRSSVRLNPQNADWGIVADAIARRGNGLGLSTQDLRNELGVTRSWVGFDDEQVVVLGECSSRLILSCYDFT